MYDKLVFHLEILQNIILKVFPYLDDGSISDLLRSCLLAVIKCIYLLPTYLYFIQDIEARCLLLTSSMSFDDLPFQEHQMTEKHHMD
jgi:hypothetical protein